MDCSSPNKDVSFRYIGCLCKKGPDMLRTVLVTALAICIAAVSIWGLSDRSRLSDVEMHQVRGGDVCNFRLTFETCSDDKFCAGRPFATCSNQQVCSSCANNYTFSALYTDNKNAHVDTGSGASVNCGAKTVGQGCIWGMGQCDCFLLSPTGQSCQSQFLYAIYNTDCTPGS